MSGEWEHLARHEGGTVVALATAPLENGTTAFFAATATGLFRSDTQECQWRATSETPLPLLTAVALSARFAENCLLFAGSRAGFFRSANAGQTWRQTLSGGVLAIAVMPGSGPEDRLFVGTESDGILYSDNGGRTWTGANPGLLDLTVLALAFSPDAEHDGTGFAATASGLYRTRNGGKSWRGAALPLDEPAVQCLAVSPAFARNGLVFAGTEAEGLWRSHDGGGAWHLVPGLPEGGIGAVTFSPYDEAGGRVAVATEGGVAFSDNGGETWAIMGHSLPPVLALACGRGNNGETWVAGQYREGIAWLDVGKPGSGWTAANGGLEATHLTTLVASSPTADRDLTLFVAGPETGLRVSRDGGRTWAEAAGGIGQVAVHGFAVVPDHTGDRVVAATGAGIYRSRDCGATWEAPTATNGGDAPAEIIAGRQSTENTPPFILVATLNSRLIASDNGGEQWHPLSVPFAGETILSLACSPPNAHDGHDRTLYVGTAGKEADTVRLWRSDDDGGNWTCWLEERGGKTLPLAVVPDGSLFVGVGDRVLRPRHDAWQTRGGVRAPVWQAATLVRETGNPATVIALAVSPDYHRDGTVFAATDTGIYRSRTRGDTFAQWSEGLATKPMLALLATFTTEDASIAHTGGTTVFALDVNGAIWRRTDDASG